MDSIQVPCSVCDGHPVAVPSDQLRDGRHPHYTCVGCAKKVDKLGRPRAARERKSMNLDHHTLRLDGERRGHRWPAGMTARSRTVPTDQQGSDLRAKQLQERLDAVNKEALQRRTWRRLAEARVLECPEFKSLTERQRAVLTLFRNGLAYREMVERLGVSKSTAANLVRDAIEEMKRRIEAARQSGTESPQLRAVLAIVSGNIFEYKYDEPEFKSLADIEDSAIAHDLHDQSATPAESYQDTDQNDWDSESWTDHILD